jgi:hypothetical protein
VSALLGTMGGPGGGNVFVAMALAAMHPERHLPDTPAAKVGLWVGVGV